MCGASFDTTDYRRKFCSTLCRKRRTGWLSRRGSPLVDMLINGDSDGLTDARERLKAEVENGSPQS